MNNVNTSVGNTSVGEEEYTLYGKSNITETLRGLTFQISANSFFQTNTHQVCQQILAPVLCSLISCFSFSFGFMGSSHNSKCKDLHCFRQRFFINSLKIVLVSEMMAPRLCLTYFVEPVPLV